MHLPSLCPAWATQEWTLGLPAASSHKDLCCLGRQDANPDAGPSFRQFFLLQQLTSSACGFCFLPESSALGSHSGPSSLPSPRWSCFGAVSKGQVYYSPGLDTPTGSPKITQRLLATQGNCLSPIGPAPIHLGQSSRLPGTQRAGPCAWRREKACAQGQRPCRLPPGSGASSRLTAQALEKEKPETGCFLAVCMWGDHLTFLMRSFLRC